MTFALLYETSDLNHIGGAVAGAEHAAIPVADRNLFRRYWNGGVSDWTNAPAYTGEPVTCPLCRILVVTYGTKTEFIDLCVRLATAIGGDTQYLLAIAEDMRGTAIEPYVG